MRLIILIALLATTLRAQCVGPGCPGGSGGGGGGGSTTAAGLTDCQFVRTSATVLTMATGCNVNVGGVTKRITGPVTITYNGASTGTIWGWADGTPTLNVGIPGGFTAPTCSGCTVVTATSIPTNTPTAPLFTWTVTTPGSWDASASTFDLRGWISTPLAITPGTGIGVNCSNGSCAISSSGGGGSTEVYRKDLTIAIGTYSGSVSGSSDTITACAAVRCRCQFQFVNNNATAPFFRVSWTDRQTTLAFAPFVASLYKDNASGSFAAISSINLLLDSAAATTPAYDISLVATTTSVIGAQVSCFLP